MQLQYMEGQRYRVGKIISPKYSDPNAMLFICLFQQARCVRTEFSSEHKASVIISGYWASYHIRQSLGMVTLQPVKVTTSLENLEMSGECQVVRSFSW